MDVRYTSNLDGVEAAHLEGFFVGWPDPPSPEAHLAILRGSSEVVLALEADSPRVVGFVTALSDGVLAAYLPLLEVLPDQRGRGIGRELVRRVRERLGPLYMTDVVCDEDVLPFYEALQFRRGTAAMHRDYARQNGGD